MVTSVSKYKLIGTTQETGQAYWASYFVNGDASGLDDREIAEADAWLRSCQPGTPGQHAEIVSCSDDAEIGTYWGEGESRGKVCELLDYTLLVYEEVQL
jgi:hypothetical protein